MSVAVPWPVRAIVAAGCFLFLCALPQSSPGQMPNVPQHMMSNPNDMGPAEQGDSSSSDDKKKAKKAAKEEKKRAKEEEKRAKEANKAKDGQTAHQESATTSSSQPSYSPQSSGAPLVQTPGGPGKKICGKKPQPIIVGSNGKVGSGARAKGKALSTLGGLAGGFLGGGGGGGGGGNGKDGPPLVKCKIKDKEMTVFTDPGTGISLKVGAKQAGDTVNVFAEVAKSPDNGTFQAAYMSPPDGDPQAPRDVGICGLWGEWSLTVSWTKTTYVDGQKVSEESGGYSKAGNFNIPGTVSSDAAPAGLWKQMGFSNASHGARGIAMQYKAPAALAAGQPIGMVIHVTRPGEDPVTTVPFNLLMTRTPNGFQFQQAPDEPCPEDTGGLQMATDGNAGVPQEEEQEEEQEDGPPPGAACGGEGLCVAAPDPCEEYLRRARDRLETRPRGGADSAAGLRDRAEQEGRIARNLAGDAGRARYDLEDATRRAEDARREADFRKGLSDKFGPHQQGQTAAYGELADSARQMGDGMEACAADAETHAKGWDEAADRYDRLAKKTDDPSLADAARQAADNAREEARQLRDKAADYRKQAKEDYDRSKDRTRSGERIQADTDKMAKDAEDAERAAREAEALKNCLQRAVAELDRMAEAQAQAARDAAKQAAQHPGGPGVDIAGGSAGPTTVARPPLSGPMTPKPRPPGGISVTDGSTPCPYPTGKISIHMVDAEVYTPWLYGTSTPYTNLADLVAQLQTKVAPHYDPQARCGRCIEQVDLWGHGDLAGGYISFGPDDAQIGNVTTGANIDQSLAALGGLMCAGGKVVINQCKAGVGNNGTKALQALADKIGVPVSGPDGEIKGCRIFGGAFTSYKEQTPGPGAKTPDQNNARDVEVP